MCKFLNLFNIIIVITHHFHFRFRNYQKEIQCEIHKPLYKNDFDVVVGKYYLAKDLEGPDYCRIKITDINKDIVNCFYVDFGDTASVKIDELKYLTDGQIQKLPFQVRFA